VWTYRTPNLMDLPRIVMPDVPPPEGLGIEIEISVKELREEINRYVLDNHE
jgi:hypothetical protein